MTFFIPFLKNVVASTSNVFEVQRPPVKRLKTVLTIMEEIQGPLGRLRHCMKEQIPVKVSISSNGP